MEDKLQTKPDVEVAAAKNQISPENADTVAFIGMTAESEEIASTLLDKCQLTPLQQQQQIPDEGNSARSNRNFRMDIPDTSKTDEWEIGELAFLHMPAKEIFMQPCQIVEIVGPYLIRVDLIKRTRNQKNSVWPTNLVKLNKYVPPDEPWDTEYLYAMQKLITLIDVDSRNLLYSKKQFGIINEDFPCLADNCVERRPIAQYEESDNDKLIELQTQFYQQTNDILAEITSAENNGKTINIDILKGAFSKLIGILENPKFKNIPEEKLFAELVNNLRDLFDMNQIKCCELEKLTEILRRNYWEKC